MEDTLRALIILIIILKYGVLILVLMEDTLRVKLTFMKYFKQYVFVLILVLMEDTLREVKNFDKAAIARS